MSDIKNILLLVTWAIRSFHSLFITIKRVNHKGDSYPIAYLNHSINSLITIW